MAFHAELLDAYHGIPAWAQTSLRLLVVATVGWFVIRIGVTLVLGALDRGRILDQTIRVFLRRLVRAVGYIVLVVVLLTMVGVDLTALMGGLAVGGFIVGFALKDSLGNLASGVMLLLYRPFNVGDFVEISGFMGTIVELGISLTVLRRFDGVIVSIPNGTVLGGPIVNFTRAATRRATITITIDRDAELDTAVSAIHEALAQDPRILADPAAEAVVTAINEQGTTIEVRAWTNNADFGPVLNSLRPRLLEVARARDIPLAKPDIHVFQHASG